MQLTQYNQSVNLNNISGRVQSAGSMQAYGGDTSGLQGLGRALGAIGQQAQAIMVDNDKRTLSEALYEYNKARNELLYNNTNGLLKTNLEGAKDIGEKYATEERKIRERITQNLNFNTRQYRAAFDDMVNRSYDEGANLVGRHQYNEGEKVKDVSLNNNLLSYIDFAQQNYNNLPLVRAQGQAGALIIGNRYEGYGDEYIQQQSRNYGAQLGNAVISTAISNKDYSTAASLMQEFSPYLSPEQRNEYSAIINEKRRSEQELNIVDSLIQQYGYGNVDAVANALANMTGVMDFNSLYNSMTTQESGGNANAVNERTGAYGSLQIMPENWDEWSTEALGYVGDMTDPETYNEVARYKLQQYYNELGAEGAAVAWYAGYTNGKRWVEGKPTAIGEGGEYFWDAKQGAGDEPSVREYVNEVMGRKTMSREEQAEILKMYEAESADYKKRVKARQDEAYKQATAQMYDLKQKGMSYQAALKYAEDVAGADVDTLKKLKSAADVFYNTTGKDGVLPADVARNLKTDLMNGEVPSLEAFMEGVGQWTNDPLELKKWENEYMKAAQKKGRYTFKWDGVINRWAKAYKVDDNTVKRGAQLVVEDEVEQYMKDNNGVPPTESQVYQMLNKAVEEGYSVPGIIFDDEYSLAEIVAATDGAVSKVEDVGNTDASGRALIRVWRTGDSGYYVVPKEEFFAEIEGRLKILKGK